LNLSNVTLIIIDCVDIDRCVIPIHKSTENIMFGDIVLLTSIRKHIDINARVVYIDKLTNVNEYSNFVIKNLSDYVNTDFVLITQWDGYVVDSSKWTDEFFGCDYIGAPWPWEDGLVGNGGFSLRSKKLLEFCKINGDYMIGKGLDVDQLNEDHVLTNVNRNYLLENGFNIASLELAQRFSSEGTMYDGAFGWHGAGCNTPEIVIKSNPYVKYMIDNDIDHRELSGEDYENI